MNSSFSNQRLYGYVAHLEGSTVLPEQVASSYPTTPEGIQQLLQQLNCLQCRMVLLEWWLTAALSKL